MKLFGCIFIFIGTFAASLSAQDAEQYDINDPRNPNCPCHKYQKQADEEYNRMVANQQVNEATFRLGGEVDKAKERALAQSSQSMKEAGTALVKASEVVSLNLEKAAVKHGHHRVKRGKSGKHGSTLPKKRRVRFKKRDNSKCTRW